MDQRVRVAVVGCGSFGKNHLRILSELPDAELVAAVDPDALKLEEIRERYNIATHTSIQPLIGKIDAAVIAAPTTVHHWLGNELMDNGIDVLIEKPLAPTLTQAESLVTCAQRTGRILQVGHLERFNPAVQAVTKALSVPLFFEIHRLSVFTQRSLDVDVVLDLMIHDLDLVLAMTRQEPEEIRAAGISILSPKVDIANVRLSFADGCIANLTASRVSTERVRKMRLFQPGEYVSLDYEKQSATAIRVEGEQRMSFHQFDVSKQEPLRLELEHFVQCVKTRSKPLVSGVEGVKALRLALGILEQIESHGRQVRDTVRRHAMGVEETRN